MAYAACGCVHFEGKAMRRLVIALAAIAVSGCSERITETAQPALLGNDLTFYRFSAAAFEHAPKQAGFWAVKGTSRVLSVRYGDTHEEFLRFEVDAQALAKRPDGSTIEDGDSIYISVSLEPSGEMIFRFSPSGLKFDGAHPARLVLNGSRRNPDIDGDGTVGLGDALLEQRAGIWKQELPLLPWFKLPSLNLSSDVMQADIHDFTGFGMAVN